ncbi:hypothetical protein BH11BAC5_BH11BAC5_09690 [soil metagenome]
MKIRINELWQYLTQLDTLPKGFVKTLVDPSISVPIYLALIFPNRSRALLIDFTDNTRSFPEPFIGKGMKLECLSAQETERSDFVLLTLTDSAFSEVFDILLEDCINTIANCNDKLKSFEAFSKRIETWRKLLETYSETGLSVESQQGLFGELIILRRLLKTFPDKKLELLTAWQGPDRFRQDFQYDNWGIEVKTNTGKDSVDIANEFQLSTYGLRHLYLWYLKLDRHNGQGATLNQMVDEIKLYVQHSFAAIELLNIRLASTGYYNHQSSLYEGTGYFIREESVFDITDGFPSLTSQNIPVGINDVKYTLNLSACNSFVVPEEIIYSTLKL